MTLTSPTQDKGDAVHVEGPISKGTNDDMKDASAPDSEPVSKPINLFQSLKTYRHASLLCMLAAVGSLSDGYQVQMSGSVIALDGFIQQFGKMGTDGELSLDSQHVALWGGKQF